MNLETYRGRWTTVELIAKHTGKSRKQVRRVLHASGILMARAGGLRIPVPEANRVIGRQWPHVPAMPVDETRGS